MAEVIKFPPEKAWCYVFKCKSKWCGAKIKAFKEDVRIGYFNGDYLESGPKSYYADCPLCGTHHIIPDSQVPPLVIRMISNRDID